MGSRRPLWVFGVLTVGAIGVAAWQVAVADTGSWLLDTAGAHYVLLSAAAAVACAVAARRSTGVARAAWALISASAVCNALADVGWITLDVLGDQPTVSIVDLLYLFGYPLLFAALWHLARARDPEGGTEAIVDGLAVAAGLGLLAWQAVVIAPGGLADAGGLLGQMVLVSYPVLDIFLIGALVGLLLASGRRVAAVWGLLAYVVTFLVADVLYSVTAPGESAMLAWTDPLYLAAYALLGFSALNASAPQIADRGPAERPGAGRFMLLGASVVAPSITAAVALVLGSGVEPVVLVITSVALGAVVTVRVARTMRNERAARRRAELAQQDLSQLALHDPLTGLPNRTALAARLTQCPIDQHVALLFIDLDRFKVVNDTAGHSVGDTVLQAAAHRIGANLRSGDEVFRLAGDEFVAMCPDVANEEEAEALGARIFTSVAAPFEVDGLEWYIGASIGLAVSPSGRPIDPGRLVRDADVAMYEAKRQGGRTVRRFDEEMAERIQRRHHLEVALRHAVAGDEIEPAYQAIVHLDSQEVAGFETLARWTDGSGGQHSAAEFIELAEQTGLITAIDHEMLRRACRFIARFNDRRLDRAPAWVSVNVSTTELAAGDLAGRVASVLRESRIDPAWLVIELTEGALTVDPDEAVRRLTEVHDLGVRLAVDDFGTGFSSLEHLLRFPVDVLKLDRVFVSGLARTTASRSVAAAAVRLADTLGFPVIAEGVETQEQAEILRELGYDLAQGFLFARPTSATDALRLADADRSWAARTT